jgi:hypothetical protein
MIQTLHDERRRQRLLTQCEVAQLAECSVGRLQGHTRRGLIDLPKQRLGSKFYYTEGQANEIKKYFKGRKRWERLEGRKGE